MVLPRALYVSFYVLYLVVVALVLWFMVHYTDIPAWIYILLVVPLAIFVIGLAVKETVMKGQLHPDGTTTYHLNGGWVIFYIVAHIAAFIMFGTGIALAVVNDSQHWWGWVLFGIGFFMTILATMLLTLIPKNIAWAIVVAVLGYILMTAGGILVFVFAHPEWWGWTVFAVALILGVMAFIFEIFVEENVIPTGCGPYHCAQTPVTTTFIPAPNALQTTTTYQQGGPEYMVMHTGELDTNGRPKYVVVHNTPHSGQRTSRIAVTGTPAPFPQPVVVPQQPVVMPQQPVMVPQQPVMVPQQPVMVPQQPVMVPQQPLVVPQPLPQPVQPFVPVPTTTTNYRDTAVSAPVLPVAAATNYRDTVVSAPVLPVATTTTNYRNTALSTPVLPATTTTNYRDTAVSTPVQFRASYGGEVAQHSTPLASNLISVSGPADYSPTGQYSDTNVEITQGYMEPVS